MRRTERAIADAQFPTRYYLDEARFTGGRDPIRNEEDIHESSTNFA